MCLFPPFIWGAGTLYYILMGCWKWTQAKQEGLPGLKTWATHINTHSMVLMHAHSSRNCSIEEDLMKLAAEWAAAGVSACLTLLQPLWGWVSVRTCCSSPWVLALTLELSREAFGISPASVRNETWHWTLTHSALKPERSPQWETASYLRMLVALLFFKCVCACILCVCRSTVRVSLCSTVWLSWSPPVGSGSICCIFVFLLSFHSSVWVFILLPDLGKIVFANMFVLNYLKCHFMT